MQGRLVMVEGTIYDLLAVVLQNMMERPLPSWSHSLDLARYMTRRLAQFNPARRARSNVSHHYDIDGTIYDLFLDSDRQYSCAYFSDKRMDFEEAQVAKKRHLAAKLAVAERSSRARHRIGLGRARAVSRAHCRLHRRWRDAVGRATEAGAGTGAIGRACSMRSSFHLQDYRAHRRPSTTASSRLACSSTWASTTTPPSSARCANCSPRTALRSSISSAARTGPRSQIRSSPSTSSPAATFPRYRR